MNKFTREEIEALAAQVAVMGFELSLPSEENGAYIFAHPKYPNWSTFYWNYEGVELPTPQELMEDLIYDAVGEVVDGLGRPRSMWK